MRKRTLGAVVVATLAGFALGSVGAASAGAPSDETLVVIQAVPEQQLVDLGDPGPTTGDLIEFHSELLDATGTAQVGDLNIQCTVNFGGQAICLGVFTIDGRGQMSVDALPTFPNATVGMVTGGNGDFANVRGEAHIQPQPDGTTLITFHLIGIRSR
ncbi:MAG TPA: hypothetical protein VE669_00415 [Actinomycetota bacterium]|nr:hypothetical protein [Actinomycetota bacterium]